MNMNQLQINNKLNKKEDSDFRIVEGKKIKRGINPEMDKIIESQQEFHQKQMKENNEKEESTEDIKSDQQRFHFQELNK